MEKDGKQVAVVLREQLHFDALSEFELAVRRECLLDQFVEEETVLGPSGARQGCSKAPNQRHDKLLDDLVDLARVYDVVVLLFGVRHSAVHSSLRVFVAVRVGPSRLLDAAMHITLLLIQLLLGSQVVLPFDVGLQGLVVEQQ